MAETRGVSRFIKGIAGGTFAFGCVLGSGLSSEIEPVGEAAYAAVDPFIDNDHFSLEVPPLPEQAILQYEASLAQLEVTPNETLGTLGQICTAGFVSPDTVVTARHCTHEGTRQDGEEVQTYTSDGQWVGGTPYIALADGTYAYIEAVSGSGQMGGDISLARIDQSGSAYMPLISEVDLQLGDVVYTQASNASDGMRGGRIVSTANASHPSAPIQVVFDAEPGEVCRPGESGKPFINAAEQPQVVGVLSAYDQRQIPTGFDALSWGLPREVIGDSVELCLVAAVDELPDPLDAFSQTEYLPRPR